MNDLTNYLKLIGLSLLIVWIGWIIAAQSGMIIAFLLASVLNIYIMHFLCSNENKKLYHARLTDKSKSADLYDIVEKLTKKNNLPMPSLYVIHETQPQIFSTITNDKDVLLAVADSLLNLATKEELEREIANELFNVYGTSPLIGTVSITYNGPNIYNYIFWRGKNS